MRPSAALSASLLVSLAALAPSPGETAEEGPWDVAAPHGPGEELSFTVSEGTWMSVDVHPDGDRFVFDLMGDLYELPLTGGTAKALTSGAAWDAEPRYSPDGETILFTSDRANNDNLWLMDSDGSRPRALTKETGVRVRDGAWTPDGEYVVARKRITDSSSIGVNELWMVHRLGGSGVQLTKKDALGGVMEPALSPDGRYIYFSRRPGRFSYNSDPNKGIWQIGRIDRETGQERRLTGEFGGAIRPTPSPDGNSLALLRRVRGKTLLELYDLASGRRTEIADWLDRDGQESFGNNGLYPRMDWTNDGRILLTAEGGFWLVDPATGDRTAVPFEATIDTFVHAPVRPKRSPVADEVQAKLVRWPVFSPNGEELLFAALGTIYRQKGPEGTPTPVDAGRALDGASLYSPAWSADGSFITFVSWDDAEGGAVWVMPARGFGKARRVSRLGPKYTNPSFSSDSTEIVVLRGSGAHLRQADLGGELWSDIVLLDVADPGGDEPIVTATSGMHRAVRPRFTADDTRILFSEDEYPEPRGSSIGVLVSVGRDGTDRRSLLKVGNAVEVVPSPDGRFVGFVDGHHVWVSAVPKAGREVRTITPGVGATPGWRLSENAGAWVDFFGDSISWGYGPEIHRVTLDEVVSWEEQRQEDARAEAEAADVDEPEEALGDDDDSASDEPAIPPSEVWPLDVRAPRAVPAGSVALVGATVLTMNGDEVLDGVTILIEGDRITAVAKDAALPAGTKSLDAAGTTIIPGLIDVHAHLHFSALDVLPEQEWRYLTALDFGVTTVHDPSANTDLVFTQSELIEAGRMDGPRVFSTGGVLYGALSNEGAKTPTLDAARAHVRRLKAVGARSVKVYQQ
ncbi:MAG: PD40 domain-containing protein, partial [Deltaproteobacteria bacterium]|nr:PD40 domain-containing protein [Deltaproteobacteria bacterium]